MKNKKALIWCGITLIMLLAITTVFATRNNPMQVVESLILDSGLANGWGQIYKVYDENNGVVCYVYHYSGRGGGISCIK